MSDRFSTDCSVGSKELSVLRIKLSIPGQPSPLDLSQFVGNMSNEFHGHQFFANSPVSEADAWVVFDDVPEEDALCYVSPDKVFFVSAESSYPEDWFLRPARQNFLEQFSLVATCHPTLHPNATFSPPFLPWMINANHGSIFKPHERDITFLDKLEHVEKSKLISVFCSTKEWRPEYRLRIQFVEYLKRHFGEDLVWFGNGVNEIPEKWDGLAPFEFTLVLENRSDRGIYTEKILDPFLSLTEPIYWGDPGIRSVLPISRENLIDIRDFQGARATIERIIAAPRKRRTHEQRLEGKAIILGELHFLRRIVRLIENSSSPDHKSVAPQEVALRPLRHFTKPDSAGEKHRGESLETRIYRNAKALYKGGKQFMSHLRG